MRALARILVILAVLTLPLLASTSTAVASVAALPTGQDCLRPPTPASPTSGLSAWIDPGPAEPKTGDPFEEGSGTSLYDVYGYAGYKAVIFDPGCIDAARVWDAPNDLANAAVGASTVLIATAVRFTRVLMEGSIGSLWDPLQQQALRILGDGLFLPLLGVALAMTGLIILSRHKHGDVSGAMKQSAFTAAVVLAGFLAIGYTLTVAGAVDRGIATAFSAANDVGSTATGDVKRPPADAVAANLTSQVLYSTWAAETFGHAQAAEEFGPRLFAAGALTREEQARIDADPSQASRIMDEKRGQYKAVAREVESKYPQAYVHLAGSSTDERLGHAGAGLLAAVAAVGYLLYCLARMAWAMVVARIGIGAAPAVALVAQVPRWQGFAMEVVTWVAGAIAKAVAFGFAYVVFLAGGVGGIMSPSNEWHPMVKVAALIMLAIGLHALMARLGMVRTEARKKEKAKRPWDGRTGPKYPPVGERQRPGWGRPRYARFGGPQAAPLPEEQTALPASAAAAGESAQRTRRASVPSAPGSSSNPLHAGPLRSAGRAATVPPRHQPAARPLAAVRASSMRAELTRDPARVAPAPKGSELATRRVVRGEVVRSSAQKAGQAAQLYKVARALPAGPAATAAAVVVAARPGSGGGAAKLFRPGGEKR